MADLLVCGEILRPYENLSRRLGDVRVMLHVTEDVVVLGPRALQVILHVVPEARGAMGPVGGGGIWKIN